MFNTSISRLRIVGITEGISYIILLFIAMPLKYMMGKPELVSIVGMIHGVLFVLYMISIITAKIENDISFKHFFYALVSSILPFGPFLFDRSLAKSLK